MLATMGHKLLPNITVNNDGAESVQREALKYFKANTFTSYTELLPGATPIFLVLGKEDSVGKTIRDQNLVWIRAFFSLKARRWKKQ